MIAPRHVFRAKSDKLIDALQNSAGSASVSAQVRRPVTSSEAFDRVSNPPDRASMRSAPEREMTDASQAHGPESAGAALGARRSSPRGRILHNSRWMLAALALIVGGAGGFLGLLVAAHYQESWRQPLQIMAFLWFFSFGFFKVFVIEPRLSKASTNQALSSPHD